MAGEAGGVKGHGNVDLVVIKLTQVGQAVEAVWPHSVDQRAVVGCAGGTGGTDYAGCCCRVLELPDLRAQAL